MKRAEKAERIAKHLEELGFPKKAAEERPPPEADGGEGAP